MPSDCPDGCATEAGAEVEFSETGVVVARTVVVAEAAGAGEVGAVSVGAAAGLGGVAGFGGGAGFSGLMPPSQEGPEYMSAVRPLVFHFSSKSAAALLGVSPVPTTSFQG